jgi:hypothetical protein
MKKVSIIALVLGFSAVASAQVVDEGSLTVTGMIESSILLTVEAAGGATTAMGTEDATSALGSFSKYNRAAPEGFTLARGASDWTLSSSIGVKVVKANLTSTDYTLVARLESAPAAGVDWRLGGSTLSESAETNLTSTGTYAEAGSYDWDIVIADSADAGVIDNTIQFTATAN